MTQTEYSLAPNWNHSPPEDKKNVLTTVIGAEGEKLWTGTRGGRKVMNARRSDTLKPLREKEENSRHGRSRWEAVRWCHHGDTGWKEGVPLSPRLMMRRCKEWRGEEEGENLWTFSLIHSIDFILFFCYTNWCGQQHNKHNAIWKSKCLLLSNLGCWLSHAFGPWIDKAQKQESEHTKRIEMQRLGSVCAC